jgi:Dyp-type peroxidase family
MTTLNLSDIQGFVARGYTFPYARFVFATIRDSKSAQAFVGHVTDHVTTGETWVHGKKPPCTLNIAFTYPGLVKLGLPEATLQSFPDEFVEGMKARGRILGDTGKDGPENWDPIWKMDGSVHIWISMYGETQAAIEERCKKINEWMSETGGASVLQFQDAGAVFIAGKQTSKEHFGFTDGFGNPDFEGLERHTIPGQGKLTADGKWVPLATGEYLLGYADEAEELPISPIPYLLARNGTFMVYRKLHQNVATFREFLKKTAQQYAGGNSLEKLAAKFVGRWRDGTPVETSPEREDPEIVKDDNRSTNFTYGKDLNGARCPFGAHIRRTNPRDAFGFAGKLVNRRRIMRRGLPYGPYVPDGEPVRDEDDRGILFMALGASLFRQFEFVQQQWVQYGNDAHQGSDKDVLLGNHGDQGKFVIPGTDAGNPPFVCAHLPDFVELRGGDYFFLPSLTGLRMIASGSVDPR